MFPGMSNCPKCKEQEKTRQELSSRYHHLYYTMEEYDRRKGKGSFKKKFPESVKMMDELLEKKTTLEVAHAKHEAQETPQTEEVAPIKEVGGVPVI